MLRDAIAKAGFEAEREVQRLLAGEVAPAQLATAMLKADLFERMHRRIVVDDTASEAITHGIEAMRKLVATCEKAVGQPTWSPALHGAAAVVLDATQAALRGHDAP